MTVSPAVRSAAIAAARRGRQATGVDVDKLAALEAAGRRTPVEARLIAAGQRHPLTDTPPDELDDVDVQVGREVAAVATAAGLDPVDAILDAFPVDPVASANRMG